MSQLQVMIVDLLLEKGTTRLRDFRLLNCQLDELHVAISELEGKGYLAIRYKVRFSWAGTLWVPFYKLTRKGIRKFGREGVRND